MVILEAEFSCFTVSVAAFGILRTVPGRTRVGTVTFGLAATNSGHRQPAPRCSREIFHSESPAFTVTVPVPSGRYISILNTVLGTEGSVTPLFGTTVKFGADCSIDLTEGTSDRENGSRILPVRGISNFGAIIGDFFPPSAGRIG